MEQFLEHHMGLGVFLTISGIMVAAALGVLARYLSRETWLTDSTAGIITQIVTAILALAATMSFASVQMTEFVCLGMLATCASFAFLLFGANPTWEEGGDEEATSCGTTNTCSCRCSS